MHFARLLTTAAIGLLLAGGGSLCAAGKQQKADQSAPQKSAQQKPASPATTVVCPEGQTPVKRDTPFGPMQGCEPVTAPTGPAAAAPATAPPTPPPGAPAAAPTTTPAASGSTAANPAVTVESGTPKATPAAPSNAAQGGQNAPATQAPEQAKPAEANAEANKAAQQVAAGDAIQLNLENADLYQVLRILGPELKINTIIDPAVKGTVTINTSTTVSRKDLFGLLEMILEINGATAVKQPNGYYAIVPMGAAKQQPMDFHFTKQADQPPPPDEMFTLKVIPMRFMPAGEMSKILQPYMSPAGNIVVQDKGNLLLISEGASKMGELERLIEVFDDPVLGRQRVRMIPVKNNLAANLIPELKSIFAGYGLTSGNPAVQLVPMDRQNSILAISSAPEVFKEVEDWVQKLDQPTQDVGLQNYVYKVQNAKAGDLAGLISALYGNPRPMLAAAASESTFGQPTGTASTNPATVMGPTSGAAPASPAATAPTSPMLGAPPAGGQESIQLQGGIRVSADDRNNQLLIQATPHDYQILQKTLKDLDILPRQVLIDARIYEVDLTGDLSLGLSAFLDKRNNLTPISTSGSFSAASALQMQTFAILHNTYELQLFLNASENRTRVKTLSAPSILVTDNTAARIQVGSEVPVPIGSALTPVQSGGSSVFAQTIQMRDVGVILQVTPRINASGIVSMEIAQEVSSAQPNATSAIVAPVINKSQFQTKAILRDGQTLALGGIITTTHGTTRNRIPLIGDIPGIGALFGSTSVNNSRKELVLLITPHVSEDMNQAGAISEDFLRQLQSLKKDLNKLRQQAPQGR